jgi:hypothetical protein
LVPRGIVSWRFAGLLPASSRYPTPHVSATI